MDLDAALAQGQQVVLAKLTQHTIDMNSGQPKRVGENELTERTFERGLGRQACHAQPFRQLHEKVRGSLDGVAAPDADKVLDDHGFVARGGPHQRGAQPRKLSDAFQDLCAFHGADHSIRQGRKGMVRRSQENAA